MRNKPVLLTGISVFSTTEYIPGKPDRNLIYCACSAGICIVLFEIIVRKWGKTEEKIKEKIGKHGQRKKQAHMNTRSILCKTRLDKCRMRDIRQRLGFNKNIVDCIQKWRLNRFGHVVPWGWGWPNQTIIWNLPILTIEQNTLHS